MACHDGHLLSATYAVLQSSLPELTEPVLAYAGIFHRAQFKTLRHRQTACIFAES